MKERLLEPLLVEKYNLWCHKDRPRQQHIVSEVHAFAKVYYRLQDFLNGQVADIGSLLNLVSGPGKDRLILDVLGGLEQDLPAVSTIGDGGRLLDLVDSCLFCTNDALESVASLQCTQVHQVCKRLQEAIGLLLNAREHAAALLQVAPVERAAALLQVASVEPQQHSVSYSHRRSQTSLFFFLQIVISKFFFPV